MLNSGFADREGRQIQGMKDLMERLRQQRRERLEQYDLGGVYEDIAEQLREVVDMERGDMRLRVAGGRVDILENGLSYGCELPSAAQTPTVSHV